VILILIFGSLFNCIRIVLIVERNNGVYFIRGIGTICINISSGLVARKMHGLQDKLVYSCNWLAKMQCGQHCDRIQFQPINQREFGNVWSIKSQC